MAKAVSDSKVLVYANDERHPAKRDVALSLLATKASTGESVIATQCLVEDDVVARRRLGQTAGAIDAQLAFWVESLEVVPDTPTLIVRAVRLAKLHAIHYFDALILSAAESAGCAELFSEDRSAGQPCLGLQVAKALAA